MAGILGGMEKTTVYLTTQQKAELAVAAEALGRSEARLIRDGIDRVLAEHQSRDAALRFGQTKAGGPASDTLSSRPRWITRDAFVQSMVPAQPDAGLGPAIRDLAPDLTDDLTDR